MGEGTSPAEGHVRPEHWPQLGNSPGATGCCGPSQSAEWPGACCKAGVSHMAREGGSLTLAVGP